MRIYLDERDFLILKRIDLLNEEGIRGFARKYLGSSHTTLMRRLEKLGKYGLVMKDGDRWFVSRAGVITFLEKLFDIEKALLKLVLLVTVWWFVKNQGCRFEDKEIKFEKRSSISVGELKSMIEEVKEMRKERGIELTAEERLIERLLEVLRDDDEIPIRLWSSNVTIPLLNEVIQLLDELSISKKVSYPSSP